MATSTHLYFKIEINFTAFSRRKPFLRKIRQKKIFTYFQSTVGCTVTPKMLQTDLFYASLFLLSVLKKMAIFPLQKMHKFYASRFVCCFFCWLHKNFGLSNRDS